MIQTAFTLPVSLRQNSPVYFASCCSPFANSRRALSTTSFRRSALPRFSFPSMVLTPSTMLPLGTTAPPFSLLEPLTGNKVSLEDVRGEKGTLVVFMCNHCPFVVMQQKQLKSLGEDLPKMGIGMVGVSSNDVKDHPDDGIGPMKDFAATKFSSFRYLFDETQDVAKAYHAACTPDIYLFDKDLKLVYRGQIDDARPSNGIAPTGKSIRAAADLLVQEKSIPAVSMKPSIGCNIKWTKGNEPDYFG